MTKHTFLRSPESNYALVRLGIALLATALILIKASSVPAIIAENPISLGFLFYALSLCALGLNKWPTGNPLHIEDTSLIDAVFVSCAIILEGSILLLFATPILVVTAAWARPRNGMVTITNYHFIGVGLAWIVTQWHLPPALQALCAVYLAGTFFYALKVGRNDREEDQGGSAVMPAAAIPDAMQASHKPIKSTAKSQHSSKSRINLLQGNCQDANGLRKLIAGWGIEVTPYRESAAFIAQSYMDSSNGNAPDILVLDMRGRPEDADQILSICRSSNNLRAAQCVLIADTSISNSSKNANLQGYDAVLFAPLDKTLLFNALHAASSTPSHRAGVSSLLERYIRDKTHLPPLEILVASNKQTQLTLIKTQLEKDGHNVYSTYSGEQALDAMTAHRFDVVMLELQLPDIDGIEVTRIYRLTHSRAVSSPIVLLTSAVDPETRKRCEDAGADAAITLPLKGHQLSATLGRLIGQEGPVGPVGLLNTGVSDTRDMASDVIDIPTLHELEHLGNGFDFVKELSNSFIADSKQLIENIDLAFAATDVEPIVDCIHALKGSAGSVGAQRLQNYCVMLTGIPRSEFNSKLSGLIAGLKAEFQDAHNALLAYIDERSDQVSRS